MRKTTLAILVLAALLMPGVRAAAEDGEKIDYRSVRWESFREASERSRRENKPLLIHFTATWCKWCTKMKMETYADRRIIHHLNDNYAMAMVDTEKLPALARKFRVESWPTLWFLDSAGARLTNYPGFASTENLLPLLEFISSKAYTEHAYQDWLKGRS